MDCEMLADTKIKIEEDILNISSDEIKSLIKTSDEDTVMKECFVRLVKLETNNDVKEEETIEECYLHDYLVKSEDSVINIEGQFQMEKSVFKNGEVSSKRKHSNNHPTKGNIPTSENNSTKRDFNFCDRKTKVYECDSCAYTCKHRANLTMHKRSKHESDSASLKCSKCEYVAKHKRNLKSHTKTQHGRTWYQCQYCTYMSKDNYSLRMHVKIKHDENSEVFKCKDCPFETKHRNSLKAHIKLKHDENTEFHSCEHCTYHTKNKYEFGMHMKRMHQVNDVFKCVYCSAVLKNKRGLVRHIRLKHDECAEVFKCDNCAYKTKNKYALEKHMKRGHDPHVYRCHSCTYSTKAKYCLTGHIKLYHTQRKIFKCCHCPFEAVTKPRLQNHLRQRHDPTREVFKCNNCTHEAKFKSSLLGHIMRRHQKYKLNKQTL